MIEFPALQLLPDESRLWLYVASRQLTPSEVSSIRDGLNAFLADWSSHGRAVQGAADVCEDRLVALAASIPGGDISGCGIDKSVHVLERIGGQLGVEWLSGLAIVYRDQHGDVVVSDRPAFRSAVRAGRVDAESRIIDLSPTDLRSLRAGKVERRAGDSWHARVFGIPAPADPA